MPVNTVCPVCSKTFLVKPYRLSRNKQNQPCCSPLCGYNLVDHSQPLKHGHTMGNPTKEYEAWLNMRRRCTDQLNKGYSRYGGRGIAVCNRWIASFENFLADVGYAPSTKHTLGRIDNDGNYEPGNVEWQPLHVQANNKSRSIVLSAFGKNKPMHAWTEEYGVPYSTIYYRIKHGWPAQDAVSKPLWSVRRTGKLRYDHS